MHVQNAEGIRDNGEYNNVFNPISTERERNNTAQTAIGPLGTEFDSTGILTVKGQIYGHMEQGHMQYYSSLSFRKAALQSEMPCS